ncbi:hypothetical protein MRB53_028156 [Persea americana]|uniref:Uncharacterized protein n=1 Tax=Persea americana TaxID=3435 RepID=A0ACC2KF40_PERAE|nr:hypothetical protein MRB53_028156 [Persea americana]
MGETKKEGGRSFGKGNRDKLRGDLPSEGDKSICWFRKPPNIDLSDESETSHAFQSEGRRAPDFPVPSAGTFRAERNPSFLFAIIQWRMLRVGEEMKTYDCYITMVDIITNENIHRTPVACRSRYSATAALSPVPEIFFSGAVATGIPGPLCWLRFLYGDESSNAQQQRSAAAMDLIVCDQFVAISVCGDLISAAMTTRSSNAPSVEEGVEVYHDKEYKSRRWIFWIEK